MELVGEPSRVDDGRYCYLFVDGRTRPKPLYLYVAVFTQHHSLEKVESTQSLRDLVEKVDGAVFGQFLALFSAKEIAPQAFSALANGFASALPSPGSSPLGVFCWPSDPSDVFLTPDRGFMLLRNATGWALAKDQTIVAIAGGGSNGVEMTATNPGPVDWDFEQGLLTLGASNELSLQICGRTIANNVAVTVSVDHNSPLYGAWTLTSVLAQSSPTLPFGFSYSLQPSAAVTTTAGSFDLSLFYPLLDDAGLKAFAGQQIVLTVPPDGAPEFVLPECKDPVSSAFRTALGEPVLLQRPAPNQPLSFCQQVSPDGSVFFAPTGLWLASVARAGVTQFDIVCGLSGLESLTLQSGDGLLFVPDQCAAVATSAPGGGASALTPHLRWADATLNSGPQATTAYVAPSPSGKQGIRFARHSQAVPLFAITAEPDGLLDAVDPASWTLAAPTAKCAFPMVPYGAVTAFAGGPTAELLQAVEGAILAPKREAIILATASAQTGTPSTTTAITPQGFMLSYGSDGELTNIQFAACADGTDAIAIAFASKSPWAKAINDALGAAQPFIVISLQDPTSKDQITSGLVMDGWKLDLTFASPADAVRGAYGSILIIKGAGAAVSQLIANPTVWGGRTPFTESTIDTAGEILSGYLADYIAQTRLAYDDGAGVIDFGDFLQVVDNPAWTGVLVLNAPIDLPNCPSEVQAMLIGADLQGGPIGAHHIIATPGRIAVTSGKALAASSFDAVVHYLRPGTSLRDIAQDSVGTLPSTGTDQFLLLHLRAVFRNQSLKHFRSAAALVISTMFGESVAAVSLDGGIVVGTNAVVIEGIMHRRGTGLPTYAFAAPSSTASVFYLASAAVDYLLVDKVDADIVQVSSPAPVTTTTTVTFKLGGWMRMRCNPTFDAISYDAIGIDGLKVIMTYAIGAAQQAPTFAFDTASLSLSCAHEALSSTNAGATQHSPTANLFRDTSLVAQWPLRLGELIVPSPGQLPADLGFQPISLPPGVLETPSLGASWFGLKLCLSLGSSGTASTPQLLSAEILLAWPTTVAGADAPSISVTPFFKLIGPDGKSFEFEVDGVIRLGIAAVRLRVRDPSAAEPYFVLELQGVGLTVLSRTLPMNGGATIYLAGVEGAADSRRLGWFGGVGSAQRS